MPDIEDSPRFKVGDKVRLKGLPPLVGLVMDVSGRFYQLQGRTHYRIYIPRDPEPLTLRVREDEIELAAQ